ncbi:hypothetical protein Q4E93_01690 [Flavitalea sp. BT771]|uniref:hypothetical protein n=1 Tax=Flavitalea sp. BT771 TaxID=3063329 RepID=UPI0026E24169|nr:hypothetical protein [Flavitalea sp. BT771]MDO6429280.1 hypothetical protein [Flavitalea sp. BT771]MDV6218592.1 hypothetical protein [Flavitalea sp. BT771]
MNNKLLPGILLSLCCIVTSIIFLWGLRKVAGKKVFWRALLLLAGWILLLALLSLRGFFADFSRLPPRLPLALLLPLPVVLWVVSTKRGQALLKNVPPQWIIYLQTFRIAVEIVLWLAVLRGLLPVQMSFEGRNFDILSGLLAIPVGYYCFVKKAWPSWVVLLYNIGGLLLLLNVVAIAVLSMPTPIRVFHNEPANTLVVQFPFIFLPGILVPLAYTLHIFSLKQWKMRPSAR